MKTGLNLETKGRSEKNSACLEDSGEGAQPGGERKTDKGDLRKTHLGRKSWAK